MHAHISGHGHTSGSMKHNDIKHNTLTRVPWVSHSDHIILYVYNIIIIVQCLANTYMYHNQILCHKLQLPDSVPDEVGQGQKVTNQMLTN